MIELICWIFEPNLWEANIFSCAPHVTLSLDLKSRMHLLSPSIETLPMMKKFLKSKETTGVDHRVYLVLHEVNHTEPWTEPWLNLDWHESAGAWY